MIPYHGLSDMESLTISLSFDTFYSTLSVTIASQTLVVFVSNESEPPAKTFGFAGLYPLLLQTTKKPLKNQKTKLAKPLCGRGHFFFFGVFF
jgi:hypothetical protein